MTIRIELQNDEGQPGVPDLDRIEVWVEASLQRPHAELEQTVRIVSEDGSRELNRRFRDTDKPSNVLAFPSDDDHLDYDYLGDLVICSPVVAFEAEQQRKPVEAHWAHLVVHGMLHLQGFDHLQERDRFEMERLEIKILDTLGYTNPYNV